MSGSTYNAYYRPKGDVFFVNFRLSTDPKGLRVMKNKVFLNVRVQRRGFNDFGDEATYVIQRVFSERFV
jgi:hypothetical protein